MDPAPHTCLIFVLINIYLHCSSISWDWGLLFISLNIVQLNPATMNNDLIIPRRCYSLTVLQSYSTVLQCVVWPHYHCTVPGPGPAWLERVALCVYERSQSRVIPNLSQVVTSSSQEKREVTRHKMQKWLVDVAGDEISLERRKMMMLRWSWLSSKLIL